ncbi:MAG TPA: prolyl oligopeptidase family serine peptidase [Propionibacteriaceae bacterium]
MSVLLLGLSVLCTATACWAAPAWAQPARSVTLGARPAAASTPPALTAYSTVKVGVPTRRGLRPGTLVLPHGPGRHPAVVMVGGSGPGLRGGLLAAATELASRGVAALVYDKNLSGYSWRARDYDALGADAADAVRVLAAHPEVDERRVGLWGFSEGGWVVASAAATDASVAYVVMVSAPTVSPGQQAGWVVSRALSERGLHRLQHGAALHLSTSRAFAYTEYRPPLSRMDQPVLAVFGAEDRTVPVATAVTLLRAQLPQEPTVQVYAGSGHHLTTPQGEPAVGYYDRTAAWIQRHEEAQLVETEVNQQPALPAPLARNATADTLLYAAAAFLLAGVGAGCVGLASSTRRALSRHSSR